MLKRYDVRTTATAEVYECDRVRTTPTWPQPSSPGDSGV